MKRAPGVIAALLGVAQAALAQSTAFTYQGDLKTNGTPANGLHDFRFRLFDAPSGGATIGSQLCVDNIPVTDGKFTSMIDFGSAFAGNAGRFLEIEVRRDTGLNCSSAAGFVTLAPRQAITPTPRATAANVANALGAPDGSPGDAVIVDNNGNVGIGTLAPTGNLHISAPVPVIRLQDTAGNQQGYLELLDAAGSPTGYAGFGGTVAPHFTMWNRRPGGGIQFGTEDQDRVFITSTGNFGIGTTTPANRLSIVGGGADISGNVGIGTTTPAAKLDVRGDIRLGSVGQFRAAAGDEPLRIIRGAVDTHPFDGCAAAPTISVGTGFSVSRQDCGRYVITFATPFAGTPVVTASAIPVGGASCPPIATTSVATSGSVTIQVSCPGSDVGTAAWSFSFIAVGPR